MIVLDANVVSELMRPSPDAKVRDWLQRLDETPLATTVVTVAEISCGLARLPAGQRRAQLEAKFTALVGPATPLPAIASMISLRAKLGASAQRARRRAWRRSPRT
jgi:predicted nucleic acid-binding protein